jgi:hypothetical protein
MIRHIVALNFHADITEADKSALYDDLRALCTVIDGVIDFQIRQNISPETAVVRGFRDLFWFDFRDITVRDAYLDDQTHQAIGARIVAATEGGADGILVLDFEV